MMQPSSQQLLARRQLMLLALGLFLAACRREPRVSQPEPGFALLVADQVIDAFQRAGLEIGPVTARPIATVTPNPDLPRQPRVREGGPPTEPMNELDARNFVVAGLGGKGGRIYIFDSAERLRSKQIWFARFPDLYPYVFPHKNVLLWLDRALSPAEAARYRAALEGL